MSQIILGNRIQASVLSPNSTTYGKANARYAKPHHGGRQRCPSARWRPFTKNTGKTEKRDLEAAVQRWKQVQQRLREEWKHEKQRQQRGKNAHVPRGNVLDDLGFSPSETLEIKVKAEIYRDLLQYIQERGFSQQELGALLGIHQPDVSDLLHGKVSKFSVGKLIKFAGTPHLGAEVRLTKPQAGKLPAVGASGRSWKRVPASV